MNRLAQVIAENSLIYRSRKYQKAEAAMQDGAFFEKELKWPQELWPIEANRYQLIWLPACPRALRVALALPLLGLEDVIETVELAPHRDEAGWTFEDGRKLSRLFSHARSSSQPLLYDKKTQKVVTDDQYNLSVHLARDWKTLQKNPGFDLYTLSKADNIDAMNGFIFDHINIQIYKAGHASTKDMHESEANKLFQTLDVLDEHLADSRFLNGDTLTDSDLRLFPNLLRADIYYKQFALNQKHITDYQNLLRYTQEIYRIPAVEKTTMLDAIVETHYRSPHNIETFGEQYIAETKETAFAFLQ